MFMTSTNEMGINGARDYGTEVYPASFSPECNAYAAAPAPAPHGTTYYNAEAEDNSVKTVFAAREKAERMNLPISFLKTVVNQPSFANGSMCNHQVRMFNTALSTGPYEPREVSGNVHLRLPMFEQEMVWKDVVGVQVDTAFIEHHLVECENFRGFEYKDETKAPVAPAVEMASDFWNGMFYAPGIHGLGLTEPGFTANASQSPISTLSSILSNYLVTPAKQASV